MKTINFYGRIIGKLAEKELQILIKDVNGKKHKVPIQSGMDLEKDFSIGEELKISYSVIPHEILVQRQEANEQPEEKQPEMPEVYCDKLVFPDEYGNSEVCVDCEKPTCGKTPIPVATETGAS